MTSPIDEAGAHLHVLRGAEHAAMERLIRASEIVATARAFLDAGSEHARPKLGAALVSATTGHPRGNVAPRALDDATRGWIEFLRERAAEQL